MNNMGPARLRRRTIPALLVLLSLWGLAGWWPMLAVNAPIWPRLVPIPIALLAVILWWLFYARGRRFTQRLLMALVLVGLATGWVRDMGGLSRQIGNPSTPTLRVAQWTLATDTSKESILSAFERDLPHVIILNRPSFNRIEREEAQRLRVQHAVADRDIVIFSRYPLRIVETPTLPDVVTLCARVETPQGPVEVLALDTPKKGIGPPAIDALCTWLRSRPADTPLILSGGQGRNRTDHRWEPMRKWLRPVYEEAGFGWPYSWPRPVPLFTYDHLWVSSEFAVSRAAYRWSHLSRHLRQTATLALPASP